MKMKKIDDDYRYIRFSDDNLIRMIELIGDYIYFLDEFIDDIEEDDAFTHADFAHYVTLNFSYSDILKVLRDNFERRRDVMQIIVNPVDKPDSNEWYNHYILGLRN